MMRPHGQSASDSELNNNGGGVVADQLDLEEILMKLKQMT